MTSPHEVLVSIMDRDDDAELEMRCLVCKEKIEKGTPHYRIVEGRIHIDCMRSFWRKSSKQLIAAGSLFLPRF